MVVCNCVADLHDYIDKNQLTEDLDGCIPYNHDEWIEQRVVSSCSCPSCVCVCVVVSNGSFLASVALVIVLLV